MVLGRIWRRPVLRANLLLATFASLAIMMSIPNSYGLALEVFDRGAWGLTELEVLTASGLILGGLIFSRLTLRGDKNNYVAFSMTAMGVCLVGVSFSRNFWLSIALMGVAGMANVGMFVPSMTLFQEAPDDGHKGRLIAVRSGFGQMGTTAGLLLGGALGASLGITRVFLVAGVAGIVITLGIYLPHRVAASRRARAAWETAMAGGARRVVAKAAAEEAALGGIAYASATIVATGSTAQVMPVTHADKTSSETVRRAAATVGGMSQATARTSAGTVAPASSASDSAALATGAGPDSAASATGAASNAGAVLGAGAGGRLGMVEGAGGTARAGTDFIWATAGAEEEA